MALSMPCLEELLSRLDDTSTALASPETTCRTLAQLLVVCRVDEPRYELLLCGGGLDVLATLAADASAHADIALVLLELVATLACDRHHHHARTRLAAKPSLLALPLHCLRIVVGKNPGNKRLRWMRIAMELLAQFNTTDAGRRDDHQRETVAILLRVLENPHDDAALLQHAVEILTTCLATCHTILETAAGLNVVAILLRILDTPCRETELQRRVLEALLVVGSDREFVAVLAANNAIHSLAQCLRSQSLPPEVETLALRLLRLLCDASQVFAQVIHEDLLRILFKILSQQPAAEATSAVCRLLESTTAFAMGCKLDLVPFLSVVECQGLTLVRAVATRSHDASLVESVFRFFATILWNATELPHLLSGATLEGLLALSMVHGDTTTGLLVTIVSLLSRRAIDALQLTSEDQSLAALFLCLRTSHATNVKFAANVYAILTRHWRARQEGDKRAHAWSGFIRIAVEILLQHCSDHGDATQPELLDLYSFLREMLLAEDGGDVVLACGGVSLTRALGRLFSNPPLVASSTHSLRGPSSTFLPRANALTLRSQIETDAREVYALLSHAVTTAMDQPKTDTEKSANRNERTLTRSSSDDNDDDVRDSAENEANDDGSDADGDAEVACEEDGQADLLTRLNPTGRALPTPLTRLATGDMTADPTIPASTGPRHLEYSSGVFQRVDFATLKASPYVYIDDKGIQYPRHPSRSLASSSPATLTSDGVLLLHEPPLYPEPCTPPDATAMNSFIEQATRRRDDFVACDPQTRARLVYENTAVYTDDQCGVTKDDGASVLPSVYSSSYPYTVPDTDTSTAFCETAGLTFDSWFESGNLERAIQIGDYEYDLVLRNDWHTTGHTQWFYFAVSNVGTPGRRVRFNIVNLCKSDSLFNQGLRPVVYSVQDAREKGVGWRRGGDDVYYFPNPFSRSSGAQVPDNTNTNPTVAETTETTQGKAAATFFTLTFTLEFPNADDTYLIAHSYPYTFSDLQHHLQRLVHQHRTSRRRTPPILHHSILCTTRQGRPCDLLTISDFCVSSHELLARRAVVFTARVHPGEPQASWIMRGIIDFLLGPSDLARALRRLFVFQLVPMLNPDGVVHGNSRCSLSACDLNRQWLHPCPQLHPTIFHTKRLLSSERTTRGLVFFGDLHGHSRKKNVFLYGCDTKKRPNPIARSFAQCLAVHATAMRFVSYPDCSFKVSKDKATTARVVIAKELQLRWCFTLEASFGGASFGELEDVHFNTTHLAQVGRAVCETLWLASLTDAALRDRVLSLVDDDSVSLAAMVESHLSEAGIVSVGLVSTAVQTPRKDKDTKAATIPTKRRRRRTLGAIPEDERKKAAPVSATPSAKTSRRVVPKRTTSTGTATLSRRKSLPPTQDTMTEEPSSKPIGRQGRRRVGSSPSSMDAPPLKPRGKPLLDLLRTFEPPDEEDTQLYRLQSLVRDTTGGSVGTNTADQSLPKPEVSVPSSCGSSLLLHRRLAASSRNVDESAFPASSQLRCKVNDALFPPPVSELLLTRSPKPPHKSLRFKGGGRQYAALAPSPRTPRHDTLLKSDSTATTGGYEPALLHASTIPLKHRVSAPSSTPTATTETTPGSLRSV